MPSKPDAQTVAQMAASIMGGFIADQRDNRWQAKQISHAVVLARAIVAEVERTQPEDGNAALAAYHEEADHGTDR